MAISSGPIAGGPIAATFSSEPPKVVLQAALKLGTTGAYTHTLIFDANVALVGTMSELQVALLRAKLALEAEPSMRFEGTRTLRDTLTLDAQFAGIYQELLTVSLALGATQNITFTAIAQMADALLLGGAVGSVREAYALITEAIAFGMLLEATSIATLTAGLEFGSAIEAAYQAAAKLVDELLLGATLTPSVTLVALMQDELAIGLTQNALLTAIAVLRDRLDFVLHLHVDDEQYIAWSMNTDSRAASRYTNYPFNSFMRIGKRYYGVSDTGLYRLEGEDDAGADIAAKLRLGMSSLGTRVMKRVASGYLGYTADGDLRLKIISADPTTGEREAHVYRLYVSGAGSQREGRVKLGKGMKAVYFDFQIENVDGADFELDVIEILPVFLTRRLRGNAGAKP